MAYVPGFDHDVFVSYAHGDDRDWITRFHDRLGTALNRLLGVEAKIWIDDYDLRKSRVFQEEILESLKSSAVFLLLPSPTYIRSAYCVKVECQSFAAMVPDRRRRFSTAEFANELFAFRCPILPIEKNEHFELFRGLTDIPFWDGTDTFLIGSPAFEDSLRTVVREVAGLLRRLRNDSIPVFLYPRNPGPDVQEAHTLLTAELTAQSYRLLPDRELNRAGQLREAALSIFLLGESYDEIVLELADVARLGDKPWIVWTSPACEQRGSVEQIGLRRYLEGLNSAKKTFLNPSILPPKLKEEALALLRPDSRVLPAPQGKPSVYLIYNFPDRADLGNVSDIVFHFKKEFHFELSDNPARHNLRLNQSDGVLVVWGKADEDWCSAEFDQMIRTSRHTEVKGLCLFDPKEPKTAVVSQIRQEFAEISVIEQFGSFEPIRLESFFDPLRVRVKAGEI